MDSSSDFRYFRVKKRNEQTRETRVNIIAAIRVPGFATYEVNQGVEHRQPDRRTGRATPPLSDDAVEELKGVFAAHLKRKHGVAFAMKRSSARKSRAISREARRAVVTPRAVSWPQGQVTSQSAAAELTVEPIASRQR